MDNHERRVPDQWKTFENEWTEKIVHPNDKEGAIIEAEFRTRRTVQERCRGEMEEPHGK